MDNNLRYEDQRLIEIILYIISKFESGISVYYILKLLYFTEKEHLVRTGNSILEDNFIVMEYGPVYSKAYDMLKENSSSYNQEIRREFCKYIKRNNILITNIRESNTNYISKKEISTLNMVIDKYKEYVVNNNFDYIKKESHKLAYNNAINNNRNLSVVDIAKEGNAPQSIINYLMEN